MFRLSPSSFLFATALTAATVSAEAIGYFDSESCVDPIGLGQCYAEADEWLSDCVTNRCKGQNIDCINVCHCVTTQNQIDCAGAHCWNQVYSCEYQQTVGDLGNYCLNPELEKIPFYPPPDNAPGSCSCSLGKLLVSLSTTSAELETCGANGTEIAGQLGSSEDSENFPLACICCAQSGMLSAFSQICPDTDPSLLGIDDAYQALVAGDENWPMCAEYMKAFPCASMLGYTPPGGDDSAVFYEPGNFPPNGTATLSNIAGSITSPVSGAVYTWTHDGREDIVTVASADAHPTNAAGTNDEDKGGDGDGNAGNNNENKKNMAPSDRPRVLPTICGLVLLLITIL
ncbi:hypothetical protein F5Y11DRAFT_313941 [Daldinia sp. FL1419]|nr:hypothetical protein F5Y11DRAFT_313941 [Daldinia sp. FL1419]